MKNKLFDVIIVGGGPAGLSAALVLGRSRRKVIIFDTSTPRNRFSKNMNGFLTRDGIPPLEFLRIARKELEKYEIEIVKDEVVTGTQNGKNFKVETKNSGVYQSKKLLIATGLKDKLPMIINIDKFYGKSVFHCPYCDGWEVRDKYLAAYGRGKKVVDLALGLKNWSEKVCIVTNGESIQRESLLKRLKKNNIRIYESKILRLNGREGFLKKITFENRESIKCDAMFFSTGFNQQSDLAEKFNCTFIKKGVVIVDKDQQTCIPGLYVAGDASRDMQMVIVAASEGLKAGVCINKALLKKELH